MNTGKKSDKKGYACCDESKMTCEECSFEESVKLEDEDN